MQGLVRDLSSLRVLFDRRAFSKERRVCIRVLSVLVRAVLNNRTGG